jgi:ADP-ribosylglycohydrolase
MKLTAAQLDRARGVLLATAAGDALGAGYEFGPPLPDDAPVAMKGGGPLGWAPGEWTDDTSMALAIAEVAAAGLDLRTAQAQDRIVARWAGWAQTAPDVGIQTRHVLEAAPRGTAAEALAAAADLHQRTGHTAGNGSLMRTAPVALAYLGDPGGLTEAAAAVSALTHHDPEAGEACVLWCHAIRHAVLTGDLDARAGLEPLRNGSRRVWAQRLEEAERARPRDFTRNGWVAEALQAAWCAIAVTPVPAGGARQERLRLGLEAAVRGGRDADTVAAIAGGLLGAACGASAVPAEWQAILHGWPSATAADLAVLAAAITSTTITGAPVTGTGPSAAGRA